MRSPSIHSMSLLNELLTKSFASMRLKVIQLLSIQMPSLVWKMFLILALHQQEQEETNETIKDDYDFVYYERRVGSSLMAMVPTEDGVMPTKAAW